MRWLCERESRGSRCTNDHIRIVGRKSADTGKTALDSVAAVLDSSGDMVKRENRQNTPRDQQRPYYGHWKQEEV